MTSTFPLNAHKNKALPRESMQKIDYVFIYENLIKSKTFWISSVYLFLSITLLTGLHMYEYFKCFLC